MHALCGCDKTSKVGTKKSALQAAEETGHGQLHSFRKLPLSDDMVSAAEKFLVDCVSTADKVDTFDELRFQKYHKKNFDWTLKNYPILRKASVFISDEHTCNAIGGFMLLQWKILI